MNQITQLTDLKTFLSNEEIKMFTELQKNIDQFNKKFNLTRLVTNQDFWISQVYDSVWPFIENYQRPFDKKKLIDIGSGCGFPGLRYAIIHPNAEVLLVDSSRKKTSALKEIVNTMNLQNRITIINDRIESIAHKSNFRFAFDIATTRAVGSPPTVAEYILPMLKNDGLGVLYCGKWSDTDEVKLQNSLYYLKGSIKHIKNKILPFNKGERNVIFIKSIDKCPSIYPRSIGKPSKYPLGS